MERSRWWPKFWNAVQNWPKFRNFFWPYFVWPNFVLATLGLAKVGHSPNPFSDNKIQKLHAGAPLLLPSSLLPASKSSRCLCSFHLLQVDAHLLQDPKRRHEPGDQAWATTPVMVDVAAQNPLCAAFSTTSDENAYLTAMCAAFVKRKAYAKAVLKVDPEPALRSLADEIAARASADGIQLKVEVAQDSAVRALAQLGDHKMRWKVRFDACVSSWKRVHGWK